MSESPLTVMDVPCSWCHVEPGEDCLGPGEGWHLNRFDRLVAVLAGEIEN